MTLGIPRDQWISQTSSQKLLTVDGDSHGDPQLTKVQRVRDRRVLGLYVGYTHCFSISQTQKSLWKRRGRDSKTQRSGMNKESSASQRQQNSCKNKLRKFVIVLTRLVQAQRQKILAQRGRWPWSPAPSWRTISSWLTFVNESLEITVQWNYSSV